MIGRVLAIVTVGLLLAAAPAPKDDPGKKDQEKLQGTWKVEKAQRGGKDAPAEVLAKLQLVVSGTKLTVKDGRMDEEAAYKLDPGKKPATIDLTPMKGDKDKTVKGIYEIDGDNLKLCWTKEAERPREFVSKADSRTILLVLKRVKK